MRCPTLLIAAALMTPIAAQAGSSEPQLEGVMAEAAAAAEAAAVAAAAAGEAAAAAVLNRSPEEIEAETRNRVDEAHAAMRLIAEDPRLGETLPIPDYVIAEELEAVLEHDVAWIAGRKTREASAALIEIADTTGRVLYFEWACGSKRYREVSQQFLERLDSQLTAYPRRLMVQRALDERELLGYGFRRDCSAQSLELWRERLAEAMQDDPQLVR